MIHTLPSLLFLLTGGGGWGRALGPRDVSRHASVAVDCRLGWWNRELGLILVLDRVGGMD